MFLVFARPFYDFLFLVFVRPSFKLCVIIVTAKLYSLTLAPMTKTSFLSHTGARKHEVLVRREDKEDVCEVEVWQI